MADVIPNVRNALALAIGQFMLEFNQLDVFLSEVLEIILRRLSRQDLQTAMRDADFRIKLLVLDVLKASRDGHGLTNISVADIRQIAGLRNFLAHAHLDENPHDDSYRLLNKAKSSVHTPEQIDALTARTKELADAVSYSQAFYEFDFEPSWELSPVEPSDP